MQESDMLVNLTNVDFFQREDGVKSPPLSLMIFRNVSKTNIRELLKHEGLVLQPVELA